MKNSIWLLLPVVTMFALFYLGYEVLPFGPTPFMYWWDFPTVLVMIFAWIASLIAGLAKGLD